MLELNAEYINAQQLYRNYMPFVEVRPVKVLNLATSLVID